MNNMRFLLTTVLVLVIQFTSAQNKRDVGSFSRIKVFNAISVELIASDVNRIEIFGNLKDEVETVNKNGTLHIRMALKKSFEGEQVTAKLYYKNLIDIQASEGSKITNSVKITDKLLTLEARHGSEIDLNVDVDKLNIRSVMGGIVTVSGNAKTLSAKLGTGGIMKAKNLVATNADVNVSTGGQSDVNVTDLLEVTIKAGGDVTVYGNPNAIEEKITLGGTITKVAR